MTKRVDWSVILFFIGLFMVLKGVEVHVEGIEGLRGDTTPNPIIKVAPKSATAGRSSDARPARLTKIRA